MTIEQEYNDVCQAYLRVFCDFYEFPYEDDLWVGNDIGGVVLINDFCITFDDIRFILKHRIPFKDFQEWYDYALMASQLGLTSPNLRSWYYGCPRLTQEQLDGLYAKHKELERLTESYNKGEMF